MAVLLENVSKTYDGVHHVLKDISLDVKPNEFVLIKGRSGSGKSTLMSLVGCIDRPTKGTITLDGVNTAKMSEKELAHMRLHKIGIVFQSHNLINDLTVLENVLLPMKIARWHDGEWKAKELLKGFDLDMYEDKYPDEISGGEQQRVAIARALANSPNILLADEPTASLDLDNCDIVMRAFEKANKEFGTTVLVASHDPAVEDYVENIYNISKGEVINHSGRAD